MGKPWVSIIGLNEDSLDGLSAASRAALAAADVIVGGQRHLELVQAGDRGQPWPVPFSLKPVLANKGRSVAVLASGDPFWHGAGGSLMAALGPDDWCSFPAPSTFQLAANALGWRMEEITCHGLHAAPYARLRCVLAPGARMICTLRDGAAPAELARWLTENDCGAADLWVMEALGGPRARIRRTSAAEYALNDVITPVAMAIALPAGCGLPRVAGLPDHLFAHDGQITKAPVRALTLSALAPRPGELLWDIGAGSGSVSIEWCLAGGQSIAFETRPDRIANIRANADAFGVDHAMEVVEGDAAAMLRDQNPPNAIFIGGGFDCALLKTVLGLNLGSVRLVVNCVTLETEAALVAAQQRLGGALVRVELSQAEPLGRMRGWHASRPVVQWSVVL